MAIAEIDAGICGFETTVTAVKDGMRVKLEIESGCDAVRKLGRVDDMRGALYLMNLWDAIEEAPQFSDEDRLAQVEEALGRIAAGSYGRCIECAKAIPVARLEALPYTKLCVLCAASHR